jgi:hypothetical protein
MSDPVSDSGPDNKHLPLPDPEHSQDNVLAGTDHEPATVDEAAPPAPVADAAGEEPSSPTVEPEQGTHPAVETNEVPSRLESTTPSQKQDDADTASSLSAPPSPLTAHRPTSSKTSVDELPLTPLDGDKTGPASSSTKENDEEEIKVDTPKVNGVDIKEKEPTPTAMDKPSDGAKLPDNQVAAILKINAELIQYLSPLYSYISAYPLHPSRIYNEFHAKNQTQALASEFQQYVGNISRTSLAHISVDTFFGYKPICTGSLSEVNIFHHRCDDFSFR